MEKSTRNYDFTKIIKPEHSGKWIALNLDQTEVIAYADSAIELQQKVKDQDVIFMRAPQPGITYCFLRHTETNYQLT